MTTSPKGIAVVTGASSGIGAIYADWLARPGYDLFLVARNQAQLEAVAERVAGATGRIVKVAAADLNETADLNRIETLLKTDAGITMLVSAPSSRSWNPPSIRWNR
jgi:short-subunit dehydrogenase